MIGIREIFLIFLGIVLIAFWLWMLVDCINRPDGDFAFGGKYAKKYWIIVIIFVIPFLLGAAIYYFRIKRRDSYKK